MGITFKVDDVKPYADNTDNKLGDIPYVKSVSSKLQLKTIEAVPQKTVKLLTAPKGNSFISTVHMAFDLHMPLTLSPDSVWLCISQGVAKHITANAEQLRKHFVAHEGQVHIEIENNALSRGNPASPWELCFPEFSDRIAEFIGKKRDLLVADFTTTGPAEKAASEIVLMDAMSKYFTYGVSTCCGFPEITLLGTLEDWKNVYRRTEAITEFDLGWWTSELLPILAQIVQSAAGKPDVTFWQSMYKRGGGSGGPYVNGWINTLFPYLYSPRSGDYRNTSISLSNNRNGPKPDAFPLGVSQVPFRWTYYGTAIPMDFAAGFMGVAQLDDGSIQPDIGWAVLEANQEAGCDACEKQGEHAPDCWKQRNERSRSDGSTEIKRLLKEEKFAAKVVEATKKG